MINSIAEKFNALEKRERLLIAVTCTVLIIAVFFMAVIEPLMKKSSRFNAQIEQNVRMVNTRQTEIDAFTRALNVDPSAAVRAKIAELEKTDKQVTSILQRRSINLMDPGQMGQVLETVLRDKPGIVLQRLSSLPVKPLRLSPDVETESDAKPSIVNAPVYSHGFEVELRGGYEDIYDYLRHLEGLSSSFFWDSLEYKVSKYPDSEVTLRVHTLSAVEGWIGG
ncbi:type II secretion system protein GspM [Neptunomonas qingdaonensis]|uniref:Type II secretion system (T2SS), protein M n=1 Tax=Neptunomonas qingdaonensis TaxID=1045558 RepID=A0A1I2VEA9_9GAMM|nr:type II secretion system protein M [Neptunomonas qingdaonensis]SFG85756.1 Type II secretion system (T2SS), protein M [Neptunomonas qingdaonensis]